MVDVNSVALVNVVPLRTFRSAVNKALGLPCKG